MRLPKATSTLAGVVFIAEGICILLFPRFTLTAFCRRHHWAQYLLNVLLDVHWDEII